VSDFVFCVEQHAFLMADHKGIALASNMKMKEQPPRNWSGTFHLYASSTNTLSCK